MATTTLSSLCFTIDNHHHHFRRQSSPHILTPFPKHPSFNSRLFSASQKTTPSFIQDDPLKTNRFLSNEELEKLQTLEKFRYFHELETGSLSIRVMRNDEMDSTVGLLSESFAESMMWPSGYLSLLMFLVKQYLIERRGLMPYTATLIGFFRANDDDDDDGDGDGELAGTVEVSFDKRGANASPPTPKPPKYSPYVCNMTVKKPLRRRGIGWHLLKASEELIVQMTPSREVYLHCRMIDEAPFNMYRKADYNVVKTDSVFILLTLQRRKYLMCKSLPVLTNTSEKDVSGSDEEQPS